MTSSGTDERPTGNLSDEPEPAEVFLEHGLPTSDGIAPDGSGAPSREPDELLPRVVSEMGNVDRNIYRAVAATPTPTLDDAFRKLSLFADHGKLWFTVAGVTALVGGKRGRQAAIDGILALGLSSAVVNQGLKAALPRPRPDREHYQVIVARHVPLPTSTSFPSGHSASAFAFANGASGAMPELAVPLHVLAAAVAWSRVHTGVHYPADVLVGSLVGGSVGQIVGGLHRRRSLRRLTHGLARRSQSGRGDGD